MRKCFFIILCILLIQQTVIAKHIFERCIDTFTVKMETNNIDSSISIWLNKIGGKLIPKKCFECDTIPPLYTTGIFRTALFIRTDSNSNGESTLSLIHIWDKEYRKQALYRIPNVTSTLKQELKLNVNGAVELKRKSYLLFTGITLLNSGAGLAYASYESPFFENHPVFIAFYGLMDLAFSIGIFLPNDKIRSFSSGFLPLTKAATLFEMILIKEHNKLGKTGYKFIIKK
jgi:hypothetical protein